MTSGTYHQPFSKGTLGSETFRIPALIKLNDGSVLAAADIRYGHGSDSPNNIDIVVAKSADGYGEWDYNVVNRFDDYADGVTEKYSASFIDSAIIQSKDTDRIFIVSDACPSGGGYNQAKKGTGFIEIDGVNRLLLTDGKNTDKPDTFKYYIGAYGDTFAPVMCVDGNKETVYLVDREFNLYKDTKPLMAEQKGSTGVKIHQNVFYGDSELCCYLTTYLWMRYSDDGGKTWSHPSLLSSQVKREKESFLGICPGYGFATKHKGKERIIFMVYDNSGATEKVSTIYSDDNGESWSRGKETCFRPGIIKTSESQIVALNNGVLRMYARNSSCFVAYADSTDGGESWSEFVADTALTAHGNCMLSFVNTHKTIDGKMVILGSYVSDIAKRADGVIRVGLVAENNEVSWISTYHINSGFFAYSCLAELSDGNIGLLYEDEPARISYMILSLSRTGELSEINGNNISYSPSNPNNFIKKLKLTYGKLLHRFNLI